MTQVDADVNQLVTANNEFAWRLYDRLTHVELQSTAANVFYSPISVFSTLALVLAGAGGDTKQQLIEALRYGHANDTHESFRRFMQVCMVGCVGPNIKCLCLDDDEYTGK